MKPFILLISTVVLLASCSKSSSNNNNTPDALLNDVQGPAISIDSMPLAVGNIWVYASKTDTYTVKVVADTIINGQFAAAVSTFDKGSVSTNYYANRSGGYYLVARQYSNPDSLAILNPAVLTLSFPITIGQGWSIADSLLTGDARALPDTYYWRWTTYVKLSTPAGTFNCCRSLRTGAYPISTYDYYSTKGLIKEVQITGYSITPGVGPQYDISSSVSLISVNF